MPTTSRHTDVSSQANELAVWSNRCHDRRSNRATTKRRWPHPASAAPQGWIGRTPVHTVHAPAVDRSESNHQRPASILRPHGRPAVRGAGNRSEAFSPQPLALQLSGAAHGLRGFAGATLGRLFVVPTKLHLSENAFPLHLLLERFKRLINVVVTHEDLHLAACSFPGRPRRSETNTYAPRPESRRGEWPYNMAVKRDKPYSDGRTV